jgi:hypothetical protein
MSTQTVISRIAPLKRLRWRVQPVSHIVKRHRRKREFDEQHFEDVLREAVKSERYEDIRSISGRN